MKRATRIGTVCLVVAAVVTACSEQPPAIVEATDQKVVIRDLPTADRDIMLGKADQVCGVHGKEAVFTGSSCASMTCTTQLYSYECRDLQLVEK